MILTADSEEKSVKNNLDIIEEGIHLITREARERKEASIDIKKKV